MESTSKMRVTKLSDAPAGNVRLSAEEPAAPLTYSSSFSRYQKESLPRVLLAEDQQLGANSLELLLRPRGYQVDVAKCSLLVLELLDSTSYDVLLIDLSHQRETGSAQEALDLLWQVVQLNATLPIIVMVSLGSVELAVEAMRRGARDVLQKPCEDERLVAAVRSQGEFHRSRQEAGRRQAQVQLRQASGLPGLIGAAAAMQPVVHAIARVGPSDANVLITGEHGTGKEVVAQTLHAVSRRASRPLVTVNTGGLPESVFETELFGHVRGAFTDARSDRIGRFELADQGTIFLDEIGNVPIRQQSKLLRVLQSGEVEQVGSSRTRKVDVRVISATNSDLDAACATGEFRSDLLFRLNTVEIRVPPLRERREDIPLLALQFLKVYVERYRREVKGFDANALQVLMRWSWPGNVRELEHTVERAVLMCGTNEIRSSDLGLNPSKSQARNLEELSLESVETILIRKALQRFQGNVSHAAEALGLSRGALYRRMEKYGL
jgi:DNA-binding NtrC family response regulator